MYDKKYSLIYIFLITILIVGGGEILWLINCGNTPQIYTDIVLEELGSEFANKSIELVLYWMGILLGLLIISVCILLKNRNAKNVSEEKNWDDSKLIIGGVVALMIGNYVFYGYFNQTIVLAEIIVLLTFICCASKVLEALTCYFIILYSITAGYRLWVFGGHGEILNATLASVMAFIFTCILVVIAEDKIMKLILLLQVLIPLLFLVYLTSDYKYQGRIINIKPEKTVYLVIIGTIIILTVMALKHIKVQWRKDSLSECISAGTAIAIMAFQRFSGMGYVMVSDMHHPAENTIAYNEIIDLGRSVFSEYIPVSGLYGFVQGFFLELFGKGYYTAYSLRACKKRPC